jgi:hypothetical protein
VFKSPFVVGHPKTDDPAYGWASRLGTVGDKLLAEGDQVDPAFAQLVNDGRYPKISASFFTPKSPANPVPGVWYLRHVGFLGGAAPAVTGLKPASFSADDDGVVTIEFAAPGAATIQTEETNVPDKDKAKEQTAEFAARQAELDSKAADLAAREKGLQEKEAKARTDEIASFAEQLVKDGKVLPREQAGLVAFMAAQDDAGTVSFAADTGEVKKPAGQWLREFLQELPPRVDFSEHSRADADNQQGGGNANFAAPTGYSVDKSRLDLHDRIVAHQKKHNVDYATAAAAVGA